MSCVRFSVARHEKTAIGNEGTKPCRSGFHRGDQSMLETTLDRMVRKSVEETLTDMYLACVSTRQVDDVCRLLWGDRMPSQTPGDKLRKVCADIDAWRERPLEQEYAYLFMDGVWHKRCRGGRVENAGVVAQYDADPARHPTALPRTTTRDPRRTQPRQRVKLNPTKY